MTIDMTATKNNTGLKWIFAVSFKNLMLFLLHDKTLVNITQDDTLSDNITLCHKHKARQNVLQYRLPS